MLPAAANGAPRHGPFGPCTAPVLHSDVTGRP